MKCICPLCNGAGRVEVRPPKQNDEHRRIAVKMRKKGFTIRQIMAALNYSHPGSISHLLSPKKTKSNARKN